MIDDRVIKTVKESSSAFTWRADDVVIYYHYGTPVAVYNEDSDRLWYTTKYWSKTSDRKKRAWVKEMRGKHTKVRRMEHWTFEKKILEYRLKRVEEIIRNDLDIEPDDDNYDMEIEKATAKAATRLARQQHDDCSHVTVRIPITRDILEAGEVHALFVVED